MRTNGTEIEPEATESLPWLYLSTALDIIYLPRNERWERAEVVWFKSVALSAPVPFYRLTPAVFVWVHLRLTALDAKAEYQDDLRAMLPKFEEIDEFADASLDRAAVREAFKTAELFAASGKVFRLPDPPPLFVFDGDERGMAAASRNPADWRFSERGKGTRQVA